MSKKDSNAPETISTVRVVREYAEALGVALILAFLFKAFILEAYSIPTGSMASTLMGRHKDVCCEACGFPFQLSASEESNEGARFPKPDVKLPRVIGGTCPQCQYTMYVGDDNIAGETYMSYNGDRIFVNKWLFNFREPRRWHVTVFRYPAKPQINYIKRLVGLENETVKLQHGDIFVKKEGSDHYEIQRKPLRALLAMLRPVDDNDYVIPAIHQLGWKTRWYGDEHWQRADDYKSFTATNETEETVWLRYRNINASSSDWYFLAQNQLPDSGEKTGMPLLITDFVAYNSQLINFPGHRQYDVTEVESSQNGITKKSQLCLQNPMGIGLNWVGDLAIRSCITVEKPEGTVSLRLVKGGVNFQCDLDLASGTAIFSIPDAPDFGSFSVRVPIQAAGSYDVMFCNIDEELRLIVNGKEINTQNKGRYDSLCNGGGVLARDRHPTELDLEPAAIGIRGTSVKIEHLKIERDLYYISCFETMDEPCDLIKSPFRYNFSFNEGKVRDILSTPEHWKDFGKTHSTIFKLEKGQFLMCGDNSAKSSDSRLWMSDGIPYYVERKYLIGEAMSVFWSHGFRIPGTRIALIPNFKKMRWID